MRQILGPLWTLAVPNGRRCALAVLPAGLSSLHLHEFRGVHVGRGASLKNFIVMQDGEIGEYAELENAILDKIVTVRRGERLIAPKQYPYVVGKAVTV